MSFHNESHKIPNVWFICGLKGCPYTEKAANFLKSKKQKINIKIIDRVEINDFKKKLIKEELLVPLSFKTFPLIWSAFKEFVGGYDDLINMTFGDVSYSFDEAINKENKDVIKFILNSLGRIFIPFCHFFESKFKKQSNHMHMFINHPKQMQENIFKNHNHHLDHSLRNFSVTFYKNHPKMIYFNQKNWENVNHFNNQFNYLCYVILHEVSHAVGFIHHYSDNYNELNLKKTITCKLLTQQTRSEYTEQNVKYFDVNDLLKYLSNSEKGCVQFLLKKFRNKSKIPFMSAGSMLSDVSTKHIDYKRWFESYDNKRNYHTRLNTDSMTKKKIKSEINNTDVSFQGGTVDFDGSRTFHTNKLSDISLSSSSGTSQSNRTLSKDIDDDLSDRLSNADSVSQESSSTEESTLSAGESTNITLSDASLSPSVTNIINQQSYIDNLKQQMKYSSDNF